MKRLITIFSAVFLLTSCAAPTTDLKPENALSSLTYDRALIENSVVYVANSNNHTQHGTGLAVEPNVIITAKHVARSILASKAKIHIRTKSGKVISSSHISVAMSQSIDIAVLFLTEDVSTHIPLSCRRAEVGEKIFSVGHPLTEEWIYTFGYISRNEADPQDRHQATTMPVANGLSGAPAWNSLGQFVGIVNGFLMISMSKTGSTEKAGPIQFTDSVKAGFSLIIPADAVCLVYNAAKRAKIKFDAEQRK